MLAFIDSPIQLVVVLLVLLIVFGPQKLPELGMQLGRALRELKRTTQELTNSMSLDDHHNTYDPPRYDNTYNNSYNNPYDNSSTSSAYEENNTWSESQSETSNPPALTSAEPPRGDFAAAAFADTSDYTTGAPPPAESGNASVYGVMPTPQGTVPRD